MGKTRAPIKRQIKDAGTALSDLMREYLIGIADSAIDTVMARVARATPSEKIKAADDLDLTGQRAYKEAMLAALAVIAADALAQARKEIPGGKKIQLEEELESIQLGEFEKLPAGIRKKIQKQHTLLTTTQLSGLTNALRWQFMRSVDTTDSAELLRDDLLEAAEDYIQGPAIFSGAMSLAAEVVNGTRGDFFDDPLVVEQIEAFEFVNEDPVSEICRDLAGTVFDVSDPNRFRYTPPLHWNCKSWIRPILRGNLDGREIEPLKPSTKRIENTIQFSELTGKAMCSCGEPHFEKPTPDQ